MDTNELSRGRLIDHLQLVVKDLESSKRFYLAVLGAINVPLGGEGPGFFWADELCVSTADSPAAQGHTTGRAHFASEPLGVRLLMHTGAAFGVRSAV